MGNCIKSGYSFQQAMESVAKDMQPPISVEFSTVLREMRFGVALEEALGHMVERTGSLIWAPGLRGCHLQPGRGQPVGYPRQHLRHHQGPDQDPGRGPRADGAGADVGAHYRAATCHHRAHAHAHKPGFHHGLLESTWARSCSPSAPAWRSLVLSWSEESSISNIKRSCAAVKGSLIMRILAASLIGIAVYLFIVLVFRRRGEYRDTIRRRWIRSAARRKNRS